MNDLDRDLREVFHDDARRVPTPASAPEGLSRSAHRRQAVFVALMGLAGAAVIAGIVAGATTLLSLRGGTEPAAQGPKTTGTLNGITITYPQSWHLIDPDTAGLNGSPTMGESPLPRIVLALAPTEAPETFGCPGRAGGEAAPLLMTIQEEPLALEGPASTPWPVELQPMNVDTSEAGCYPDWQFVRAGWTASGRTFEARVGISPDASNEERNALSAAFASMTFEPSSGGATSVVLTRGTAGGEDWQLIAARQTDGLSLSLEARTFGTGTSGYDPTADQLRLTSHLFGTGSDSERVVFGAVPIDVTRVEATRADGSVVSADVLDVPNEIDPDLNAFLMVVDANGPVEFRGYDASDQIVAQGTVRGGQQPSKPEVALEDGRHFGYVRAVDTDGGTIEFDLAYFLSGEEANQAYHAAGGTGPVPNDHFVVNDNPTLRTLTLAPDVRLRLLDWNHCCETFFDGDLSLFAQAIEQQSDVTDGDLIYRGQSSWWITVKDGVVTEIEEQYSP